MKKQRREFLKILTKVGLFTTVSGVGSSMAFGNNARSFSDNNQMLVGEIDYTQQPLPYPYAALEPYIDALTMEIHYTKHAAGYTKNLADACAAEKVNTSETSLSVLLSRMSSYSVKMRNNGGGHYNHEFFWRSMKPAVVGETNLPTGELAAALVRDFGSLENFQNQFTDAAKNRFGSGWAWLVKTADGKLKLGSTPNQDNPLMDCSEFKGTPLLGLDVWEHAYYLKYQNKRPDYIKAFWSLVHWKVIEERFKKA
jgi:Fe-Mn family superoxide dismutase